MFELDITWTNTPDDIEARTAEQMKNSLSMVMFRYGRDSEFMQFYLMEKDEAVKKFTGQMNERDEMEIKDEGWTVTGLHVLFTDNEAFVGSYGPQMQRLSQQMLGQLLGGGQDQ